VADEEGTPAPLYEAGLEGVTGVVLDKSRFTLGQSYIVRTLEGRELFQIERPTSQAAASEIVNFAAGVLTSGRDRDDRPSRRRKVGPWAPRKVELSDRLERRIARHYEMWTLDDRWLGRIERDSGMGDMRWVLYLSDWRPYGWVQVQSQAPGPFAGVAYDSLGRVVLQANVPRPALKAPLLDARGQVVGEMRRGQRNGNPTLALTMTGYVHPILYLLLTVVCDYESNPGQ
jgi:hypothetical protein